MYSHKLKYQYWYYREIENYISNNKEKNVNDIILDLQGKMCDEDICLDRESLFRELYEMGMPLAETLMIVKRVRRGKKISVKLRDKLKEKGCTEEFLCKMDNIRYIRSRRQTILKILFVTKLIEKENYYD